MRTRHFRTDAADQRDPALVQTLIFSKEKFTEAEAKSWAEDHDFSFGKVDETENSFRLRQKGPDDFQDGSLKTIDFGDEGSGIQAVVGRIEGRDDSRRVIRYDRSAAMMPAERTREGYLRVPARVAKPGVLEYRDSNGNITLELIDEDELHNADSLRSMASKPVTLEHPLEEVNPDNISSLSVGDVGERIEILSDDGGFVQIVMVIRRRDAIEAVDDGKLEVSPGYSVTIDPTPGVHPQFGRYDAVQRNRRYNHVAIVDEARGGPTIRLRADSAVQVTRHDSPGSPPPKEPSMNPHLLALAASLGVATRTDSNAERTDEQVMGDIQAAIAKLRLDAQNADAGHEEKRKTLQDKIDVLTGELEALKKQEEERTDAADKIAAKEERDRLDSLADVLRFDRKDWKDDTPNADCKLQIARHANLVKDDETPSEPYLDGVIATLAGRRSDANPWKGAGLETDEPPRRTRTDSTRRDSRPKDAFKEGLNKRRKDGTL